jgi:hypothetical protein
MVRLPKWLQKQLLKRFLLSMLLLQGGHDRDS